MTLGPGGTSVILTLGSFTAGKPLTLTASGLTGANGRPLRLSSPASEPA